MRTDQTEKPGFQIGIAMAGAVSAGAYTAGVFDFLMEALTSGRRPRSAETRFRNTMSSYQRCLGRRQVA